MNLAAPFVSAVVAAALLVCAFYLGRCTDRVEVVGRPGVPIIETRGELPPAADIIVSPLETPAPERIIRYLKVPKYTFLKVPVPTALDGDFRITSASPLKITGRKVELTWFDPDSLRYESRIYAVPRERWGVAGDLYSTRLLGRTYAGARLRGRYGRMGASVGYAVGDDGSHGLVFGARFNLFTVGRF